MNRSIITALLASSFVLVSSPARSDPEGDAQDLFVRGREARRSGDCIGAVTLFRKAHSLAPLRLGALRNIAECEEQTGHFVSARRAWLELERGLLTTTEPAKYAGWADDASKAAARLKPKVAEMTVEVIVVYPDGEAPAAEGQGIELSINGEPVPHALFGTSLERDPGHYEIVAKAPGGGAPERSSVDLLAGSSKTLRLRLTLRGQPARASVPPAVPLPPASAADRSSARRTVGWITIGVGAASAVASLVSLGLRQSALGDLRTACPGYESGPCPTSAEPILSRGSTASTLTSVFAVTGGVLLAGGAVLVLTSPTNEPAKQGRGWWLAPTFGGLELSGRFR